MARHDALDRVAHHVPYAAVAVDQVPGVALDIGGRPHALDVGVPVDAIAGDDVGPGAGRDLQPLRAEGVRVAGEVGGDARKNFAIAVQEFHSSVRDQRFEHLEIARVDRRKRPLPGVRSQPVGQGEHALPAFVLGALDVEAGVREPVQIAGVIEMEVGQDDVFHVVRREADLGERGLGVLDPLVYLAAWRPAALHPGIDEGQPPSAALRSPVEGGVDHRVADRALVAFQQRAAEEIARHVRARVGERPDRIVGRHPRRPGQASPAPGTMLRA